jgi:hypothetical protein
VVLKHALRNALVPIVTVIGLTVALMIGGAVITETVFGLPGVGNLVVSAVLRRDYPVIQGAARDRRDLRAHQFVDRPAVHGGRSAREGLRRQMQPRMLRQLMHRRIVMVSARWCCW